MVEGTNWSQVHPAEHEGFELLGAREQNAALVAMRGIASWQTTFEEPKPMRVVVTSERPFNMRAFAGFMHTLHVGVAESLTTEEDGSAITFQPKPYSEEFHAEVLKGASERLSRQANGDTGSSEIDELLKMFDRFQSKR